MNKTIAIQQLPSKNEGILVLLLSTGYLIFSAYLVGLRMEHWVIVGLYNLCYFISPKTRKIILAFTIFVVFAMVYDMMNAFPNYKVNHVDIAGLYHFEQKVFGFSKDGVLYTFNEFFASNHNSLLDVISGIFYINWIPVPLAFAFYLYVKNKKQFLDFSLTFFLVNILGFCIYYIHPAAPPWYVCLYGFDFHLGVSGNTAGLTRFDSLLNINVFHSIYARNANVFAALPSLHSAYPVVVLYYGLKNRLGKINWLLAIFMAGIWFAAVYSGHHYVTDVIAGILCSVAGIFIYQKILLKISTYRNWITHYEIRIS